MKVPRPLANDLAVSLFDNDTPHASPHIDPRCDGLTRGSHIHGSRDIADPQVLDVLLEDNLLDLQARDFVEQFEKNTVNFENNESAAVKTLVRLEGARC